MGHCNYWCRGHAEESCVKYVYLEKWNEKNEWVKYRQVQNAPVNERVHVERVLYGNGLFGELLWIVITFVCLWACLIPICVSGYGPAIWGIFIPGYWVHLEFPWC